jgi:carboxymethylenebutenolidase
MSIRGEWIEYGDERGYLAIPEKAAFPIPGIVVIAEVFGVNDQIEDVVRRFAGAGYAAIAPDFYTVNGKHPDALSDERIKEAFTFIRKSSPAVFSDPAVRAAELSKLPEEERDLIAETFALVSVGMANPGKFVGSLRAAVRHLRHENPAAKDQKVGCVGFCMGGGLSALLACEEPEVSAAAVFYGMAPPVDKIPNINCPVVGFYGAMDQRVNSGIPAFADAMKKNGKSYEPHIFENAGHSFFNDDIGVYNVHATRVSYSILLNFFLKHLTP